MFDDPLLIRSLHGMQCTARARAIQPQLENALEGVANLIAPLRFDPARARGQLRIAAPDIVAYMLVPALLRRLAIEAPDLNLSIVQWEPAWREHLERGTIDLTIGAPTGEEPGIYSRLLLENQWTCVLRKGHRALRKRWTPESYASLGHMIVSLSGRGGGQVDRQLEALGLTRRIVLRIPYSTLTPLLVAETELVLTTAHWLAVKLNASGTLAIKRPPFELPPVKLPMVWHERTHRDPQQRWFRTLLAEVAAEVDPLL